MNREEPKVLTRMRLSCCWGDNLNEKELNEVIDYINWLKQKVTQLETKINTYENPEDMTLMFMWCNEKAKDKIKELQQRIDKAIEILNQPMLSYASCVKALDEIEEILKGSENNDNDKHVERNE